MAIRTLIVDDMELARKRLRRHLQSNPALEIVGEARGGLEAIEMIRRLEPQLLVLDVQMPEVDGFDVLEAIDPKRMPAVIFVTAHDEFALRAFDVHAIDYLLKPFSPERLSEALARARDRLQRGERASAHIDELTAAARPASAGGGRGRVLVRDGPKVHVLPIEKIEYVQAQDDYVSYRCEGKDYLKEQTLAQAEAALDPSKFVRIHRSYLLNMACLARIESSDGDTRVAILNDGRRLPVSRAGYARLSSRL